MCIRDRPNEACAAIGMLCKLYGLPIPEKREMVSEMKADLNAALKGRQAPSEFAEKIISLLDGDVYKRQDTGFVPVKAVKEGA